MLDWVASHPVQHSQSVSQSTSHKWRCHRHYQQMCSDSLRDKSVAKPRNECRQSSLAVIFKSVVLAKILYASPAWWGWANSSDTDRLEAFLRRCTRLQLYRQCDPTVNQLVEDMEDKLFTSVINNDKHVLSHILPEPVLCCFAFLLRCCVLTVNFTH